MCPEAIEKHFKIRHIFFCIHHKGLWQAFVFTQCIGKIFKKIRLGKFTVQQAEEVFILVQVLWNLELKWRRRMIFPYSGYVIW